MVRSDMQMKNVPNCLEIMKNQFSEKSLDIWEHLKTILRITEFQMILMNSWWRSLLYRDQSTDFHGRSIDWFSVRCGPPSWSSWGFFKQLLVFRIIWYLLFHDCYKIIPCRPMLIQCSILVLPVNIRKFSDVFGV